ncbi:MAG: dockerin type I repeat-containing protein, partial [Oscillospiraceae bacterium]|nr:dockerin type I repeat-containing protein [Oscillospiraceae bacterium]
MSFMKKNIAFMAALVLLSCYAPLVVSADETKVTHGYIPEGLPVATDTIEFVDAETASVLFDMRDQLRENVFVNYPDSEVHAVVASDIVNDVYVCYTSSIQAELDEAKAYCEANGFDMSIMKFYLYDESKIVTDLVNEVAEETEVTHGYIPEELPVATDTIEFVDAETAAVLFDMRDQLRENVFVNYPDSEVHAVVASDIVNDVYVAYTSSDSEELSEAKKYCEEHNFDLEIMRFYLYSEENLVDESYNEDYAQLVNYIKSQNLDVFSTKEQNLDGKIEIVCNTIEAYYAIEKYMAENSIDRDSVFLVVNEANAAEETVALEKGDANGDGKTDILDVITVNKAILGKEALTDEQNQAADVNGNNKVDSGDSLLLMKFVVGLIDSFDVQ